MPLDLRTRWAQRTGVQRLAVVAWAAVLVVTCGRALAFPHAPSVYPVYAAAARAWVAGRDLYQAHGSPYRYSPAVAVFLTPLGALPEGLGGALWRLLNVAVYLAGLGCWARAVLPRRLSAGAWAALFLLVVPLSVGSLHNGQSNALVTGLVLFAIAGVARRRWNAAAGAMTVACLFKLYPVAVGLLLAACFRRRFADRFAVALALGLLLPFAVQRPAYVAGQYQAWAAALTDDDRQGWPLDDTYRDLRLLCRAWLVPLSARDYLAVQVLAGAGMAALAWARRHARGASPHATLTLITGLGGCWMTALGPATESCTYVLIAPSLAWAVISSWREPRTGWGRYVVAASYGLLLAQQVALWFPGGKHLGGRGPQPLAALLLLGYLAAGAWREFAALRRPTAGEGGVLTPC